jgi:hypothetical protein
MSVLLMRKKSTLGKQLEASDYKTPVVGPVFTFGINRKILKWLVVGARLGIPSHFPGVDAAPRKTNLTHLTWTVHVSPILHYYSLGKGPGFMGLHLGFGGQTVFWTIRNKTETGMAYRVSGGFMQGYLGRGLGVYWRMTYAFLGTGPIGPNRLSFQGWGFNFELVFTWGF